MSDVRKDSETENANKRDRMTDITKPSLGVNLIEV